MCLLNGPTPKIDLHCNKPQLSGPFQQSQGKRARKSISKRLGCHFELHAGTMEATESWCLQLLKGSRHHYSPGQGCLQMLQGSFLKSLG